MEVVHIPAARARIGDDGAHPTAGDNEGPSHEAEGLGFRFQGLGFRVYGLRVQGLGFRVFWIRGSGWVLGSLRFGAMRN